MIRRPRALNAFGTVALVALLAVAHAPPARAKSYRAERYRTEIRLQPDGSLRIREEIRIRFDGGPFTFFYRGLPLRHTEGIVDLASPESLEVRRRRSRIDVTWRFEPTRDAVRTFALEYTAKGTVRYGPQYDRLRWWAFPKDRSYEIDDASAVLVLPPGWPPARNLRTEPGKIDFRIVESPDHALALQGPVHPRAALVALGPTELDENRSVILQADLEPGYVQGNVPAWQQREKGWRERMPAALIVASFLFTFGLFWVLWSRSFLTAQLNRGANWSPPTGKVLALTSPPEDASPALVGTLTYGVVSSVPILATLFDLARRGVVRFGVGTKRFAWSSTPIRLTRGPRANGLPEWETLLVEAVFRKADADGAANWSRVGYEIQKLGSRFQQLTREELVRRGDFDPLAISARRGLYYRGAGAFGLAVVLIAGAVMAWDALGPYGLIPALAAVLVGSAAMVAGATLYPHTAQGAQRVRQWRGFAKFMKESSKGNAALDTARFHQWLPLAVALGVAPAWVKAGKRWGLSTPDWFRSPSGELADIAVLMTVVSASSSHGGGSGGAGGGGSSGAG